MAERDALLFPNGYPATSPAFLDPEWWEERAWLAPHTCLAVVTKLRHPYITGLPLCQSTMLQLSPTMPLAAPCSVSMPAS